MLCDVKGRMGKGLPEDLPPDYLLDMMRLQLEAAVVGPEIDRRADTSDTALIYLLCISIWRIRQLWVPLTSSAASGPAIENSRSAYFFQYPKKRGKCARKWSYVSRVAAIAWGLEFRFRPPSCASAARTSFSQCSNSSGSSSWIMVSVYTTLPLCAPSTHHLRTELLEVAIIAEAEIRHVGE